MSCSPECALDETRKEEIVDLDIGLVLMKASADYAILVSSQDWIHRLGVEIVAIWRL